MAERENHFLTEVGKILQIYVSHTSLCKLMVQKMHLTGRHG